ncbi:MAG: alpha/beta hydrolase [Polyangiales bacterium]
MIKRNNNLSHAVAMLALGQLAGVLACSTHVESARAQASAGAEVTVDTPKPITQGFIEVNGFKLWHEIYGEGPPVVVLHGGLMTIGEMLPLIAPLAKGHKVIGVELQGHGHTPDTDRPLTLETSGDDVAALIAKLGFEKADVVGYSFGADVALRCAIQHPERVRRLVVISTAAAKRGWYPEAQEGMGSVNGAIADQLKDTPGGKLAAQWPDPSRFPKFLDKMGEMMGGDYDWTAEVKQLPMSVMLVYADHDSVSQQHIAEFYALLGGGITEPGWIETKFTKARLAVIPGYSHYNFMTSTEIAPLIGKYLDNPLTPSGGAAAASTVSQ